jgi:hypothetical protein
VNKVKAVKIGTWVRRMDACIKAITMKIERGVW